ncbi:MAG: S9 family peptidase, partial [Abitibacteriaceae bacterium]|nr:S9 family peptidase [Abditibacteriaceae bacterium]
SHLSNAADTTAKVEQKLHYPQAHKVNQVDDYHGVKVADPYRWLEDANSAETAQWVEAENAVTFGYLKNLPQREPLRQRLTALWNYPKYGAPFKEGGQYFYFKNEGLQNQAVLYVQSSLDAPPRVLLDPNTLSPDGTVALSGLAVSDDGKRLAYGLAKAGSDWQEFHVRDVADDKDLEDDIQWAKFTGPSWTKDNRGFFYSRYPQPDEKSVLQGANRLHKIYYHALGTAQAQDKLIYERPDEPEWLMNAGVTEEGDYAIISLSKTGPKNRVYYIDLKDPQQPTVTGEVVKLIDVFEASYSFIGHDGTTFYFETDSDASRGRVIAIDIKHPDRANWRTIIPEGPDTIQSVSLIGNQLIVNYLHNAYSTVRFYNLEGKLQKELELPGLGTVGSLSGKRTEHELFYTFTSFLYPPTIYRYDVTTGQSAVFRKSEAKFDPSPYETYQVFFTSKDGTCVPMFITHRKGLKRDGSNPTYLTGYGGFNISLTPYFSISQSVWLENGGILAIPNLRGGGEFGEAWHKAGTQEHKQNVFDDFVAAAEYLIQAGYTKPSKLAIAGGSNGGLLIGAVINQRPDLFGVALPAVGVMDMLRFHKFTIGSAWVYDYGSSDDPTQFKSLYAYSPLHNIKPGTHYPATLVTTADHDDRVVPGHSFKYAATLQAAQAGDAPVLIRIETKAGHGAGKPTAKIIEEEADRWAFVMQNLGMGVPIK